MTKNPTSDDIWKSNERRSGLDRRSGGDRRSGKGFRPDPDRRVGATFGEITCPWGNLDRRQAHYHHETPNDFEVPILTG